MNDMLEKMRQEYWRLRHKREKNEEEAKVLMKRLDVLSEENRKLERETDKLWNAIETAEKVIYGGESEESDDN